MTSLSAGDHLGPYEILEQIGTGGMGRVYRARDARLSRVVAVKTSTDQFSDRFEREARAIAQFNHPHICQLYDVGPDYLVMEYIEGTPVQGPLPAQRVVPLACEILDAIAAAHRLGITHRDLKPANVLVTDHGIKLLDFGLAKATTLPEHGHGAVTEPVTVAGQIVGTLQYMSPEQLQGKTVDARSDLFSFGCVLYEMLTGTRAFDGADAASVIAAVLTREAPSVAAVAPPLDRIVRRALAKDPEQRFQTAGDLKAALLWAMEQPAPPLSGTSTSRPWRWVVATAAIALAGVLAGWAVARAPAAADDDGVYKFTIDAPPNGHFVFGVNAGGIALSPDGTTVAFVASIEGRNSVWVRRFDETEARMLPGTADAGYVFWSPDGRSMGFATSSSLRRVDLAGGLPIVICAVNALRGAAWSADGKILFGTLSSGLQRVPAAGGTPEPVTTLDAALGEGVHAFPQWLDDDRFLYFARAEKPGHTGVYVSSFRRPAERSFLLETEANAFLGGVRGGQQYLMWTRGGTLLAQPFDVRTLRLSQEPRPIADGIGTAGITGSVNAAASANGVLVFSGSSAVGQFTWFDRSGEALGVIGEPGDYNTFDLSADGQRLVVSRERQGGSDVWMIDTIREGVATRLTMRPATSSYPVWSPDGTEIVFGSGGLLNVFHKRVFENQDEQRLTDSVNTQLPLDWSPDGSAILFYQITAATGRDLMIIPAPGRAGAPAAYLQTRSNEWWARFAPVQPPRWIAYQSDESGRWEVYVDTYPKAGGRRRISTGGGQFPEWGPGGRELFFVSPEYRLMSAQVTLGDTIDSSEPRGHFPLPAIDTGRRPYEVAPDGQRILVRAAPSRAAPLTVIVNWPAMSAGDPAR